MLFNSLTFLVFFAIVLVLHHLPFSWRVKKINLLIASYLFYAAWNPPFVLLLWISTATDFFAGRKIDASATQGARRRWLGLSLAVNLGLLAYFKYAGFVLENFVWAMNRLGIDFQPAPSDIILPLGISFYTFQTLSYSISIYRKMLKPTDSLLDFSLFVTFFPQLVAGPIVRAGDFLRQLDAPRRATPRQFGWGLALLELGLFEKIVLADAMLAPIADRVYASPFAAGALDAWVANAAFGCQIFFDFAGYSACAIGAALCLGFVLPRNFNCPYAAVGLTDFWRRWHITLSTWLRDYVYFTIVSSFKHRQGFVVMSALAATMLLGGLWHGAAWTFVFWGGLHGVGLALERWLRVNWGNVPAFRTRGFAVLAGLATFVLVTFTWAFFRAPSFDAAWAMAGTMLTGGAGDLLDAGQVGLVGCIVALTLTLQAWHRDADLEERFSRLPLWMSVPLLAIPILCILVTPGDQRAFIYFQF